MKVGIDISGVIYETGVSVYTKNLVENLLKIDTLNEYVLFGGSLRRFGELQGKALSLLAKRPNCKAKIYPIAPSLAHFLWNRLHVFPIENLVGKIDVFHSSDWTQPKTKAFSITTIHDLVPLLYPKLSHPKIVSTHRARLKWVIKQVDRVIVPSRTTFEDTVRLGVKPEKLRLIPEACDSIYKPAKKIEMEKFKKKYRIHGKYILAVGTSPRKNLERIIEGFAKVSTQESLKLVVVGEVRKTFPEKRGIVFLGHIPISEMPIVFTGASALVYPSLYEGFGLPILEAFSCKVPVVTSNFGSMAEVAGDAAVCVDPYKVDSITEGIEKAIFDRILLIKRGAAKVKNFSWQGVTNETLKVYSEAKGFHDHRN